MDIGKKLKSQILTVTFISYLKCTIDSLFGHQYVQVKIIEAV
jgi:hypothetical protein